MKKYVIVPGCSDLNRGDQALVWETKRIAEDCGFIGEFYLTSEKNEPIEQSKNHGLKIITPLLEHPSRKFKNKQNINYTRDLKVKWGIVSLVDMVGSLFILWKPTRRAAKSFISKEKRHTLEILEQCEAVFMKGGGLLQTYGGLASTYSMYFWVYPILLAHKLKKPVYVMPNSFGPFEGPMVKDIVYAALRKCKVLNSRETFSEHMVRDELGLNTVTYPDLAFSLRKADLDKDQLYKIYHLPTDRKLVAMTMRPYRFPFSSDPKEAYEVFKKELAYFIEWLYGQGYMAVIVEHTLAVNDHEDDGACIKDVISMVNIEKYRLISNDSYDCSDLKCIYSYCDYIVGTRFHSMIFAFGSGIPGIAISYTGNKAKGIMHDMELDEYVIEITDVSAKLLKKKFMDLIENESEVKTKIEDYRKMAEDSRMELIQACRKKAKGTII